jgi:hypothetical protein
MDFLEQELLHSAINSVELSIDVSREYDILCNVIGKRRHKFSDPSRVKRRDGFEFYLVELDSSRIATASNQIRRHEDMIFDSVNSADRRWFMVSDNIQDYDCTIIHKIDMIKGLRRCIYLSVKALVNLGFENHGKGIVSIEVSKFTSNGPQFIGNLCKTFVTAIYGHIVKF